MEILTRREMLQCAVAMAATGTLPLVSNAKQAAPLDRSARTTSTNDAHLIWAKLHGDLSGRTVYYFTQGTVWGFKPQADDLTVDDFAKRVYGYSGVAARKIFVRENGAIVMRQKSWAFYRNPVTDEITDQIPNPYTGVVDIAAPMSPKTSERVLNSTQDGAPEPMRAAANATPYNLRIRRLGARAWVSTSTISRFQPGGISWWKLENALHDYACATADLDSSAITHIPNTMSQNVVAEWQTWTKMHGTPGHILFKGNGAPLFRIDEVPGDTLVAIERFFPGTLADVRAWI
jgi:hypothetical protein